MHRFVVRLKNEVAKRLDRKGALFAALKRAYGRVYRLNGERQERAARALRKIVAASEGRITGVIVLKDGCAVEFADGSRFRYRPTDPADLLSYIVNTSRGEFEDDMIALAKAVIREGDVVLDVGANFGWYTVLFSRLAGSAGAVRSFEPAPDARAALEENVAMNGLANVRVEPSAVGAERGKATLHLPGAYGSAFATLVAGYVPRMKGDRHVEVPVIPLDEYVREQGLGRVDVIKCDVEGFETEAFRGAAEVLRRHAPVVLVEINGQKDDRGIFSIMEAAGYQPFYYENGRLAPLRDAAGELPGYNFVFVHPRRGGLLKALL